MGIFLRPTPRSIANSPRIRWLSNADLPDILAIDRQCWDVPWDVKDWTYRLRCQNVTCQVAERCDVVAGYCLTMSADDMIFVERMAVDPVHRGCGCGRKLVEKLQRRVKQSPTYSCIVTFVSLRDLDALEFCKRRGFRAIECIEDQGHDLISLQWGQ